MRNITLIIFYNRAIDEAKKQHDVERACYMLKQLRKLEKSDKVETRAYRIS